MMNITVNIESPQIADAIQALAAAIGGNKPAMAISAGVTGGQAQSRQQPAADENIPDKAETIETQEDAGSNEKTPVPSIVEIREKAQQIGKTAESKHAIKALLDKYGSKSISNLPEEHRAAFLADLLGAI
ncbi:MAG TPA: hypothetical protein VN441_04230 [Syntrophomonas sp.]|nr:hypothetical protein [Syntrophomonas sp.]